MTYCYEPEFPPDHECWEYETEARGHVYRNGAFLWWHECEKCGQVLTKPEWDSVL